MLVPFRSHGDAAAWPLCRRIANRSGLARGASRRGWPRPGALLLTLLGACLGLVLCAERLAAAQARGAPVAAVAQSRPLRLSFSAPEGCPDSSRFIATVTDKTSVVQWTAAAQASEVLVLVEPGGKRGRIEMRRVANGSLERVVEASNCSELIDALAFVLVVAVDPRAELTEPPAASDRPPAPTPKPPTAPASSAGAPLARRSPPPLRQQLWALNLSAASDTGLTGRPGVAAEFGTSVWLLGDHRLETRALQGQTTSVAWAPELGLNVGWLRGSSSQDGVNLTLNRFAARASACPVFLGLSPRIWLSPCAELQAGRIVTRTEGLMQANARNLSWWATGVRLVASARWPSIWVSLGIGLPANIRPHGFSFRDSPDVEPTQFARTPRWASITALTVSIPILRSEL